MLAVLGHFLWNAPCLTFGPTPAARTGRLAPPAARARGQGSAAAAVRGARASRLARRREQRWLDGALAAEVGGEGLTAEEFADPPRRPPRRRAAVAGDAAARRRAGRPAARATAARADRPRDGRLARRHDRRPRARGSSATTAVAARRPRGHPGARPPPRSPPDRLSARHGRRGTVAGGARTRDARAVARAISLVEDGDAGLAELSAGIYPAHRRRRDGRADRGARGSASPRSRPRSCAWRAPTGAASPCSRSTRPRPTPAARLLGDRVRMQEHATDPDVFIRSMATRGHLGGMALAAPEAVRILDAAGYDLVDRRDGRRGAGRDRGRRRDRYGARRARSRARRRDPDGEGRDPGGGRPLRREQGGPRRRRATVVRELRQMLHLGAARPWDPPVLATSADRRGRGSTSCGRASSATARGSTPAGALATRNGATAAAPGGRVARPPSGPRRPSRAQLAADGALVARLRARERRPVRRRRGADPSARRRRRPGGQEARRWSKPTPRGACHAFRHPAGGGLRSGRATPDGLPGAFPFTRGPYASMYRGRLWTMRQFAGYGTPAETNERFRLLLERGQTGLSVAFDMPTLMGLDPDDPRSEGEVGRCGVAVATLDDTETLFAGIPLDEVTVSMTINGPAAWIFACYLAAAERQGVASQRPRRHPADRHLQGVHRTEGVAVPAAAAPAADRRPAWRSAPPTCPAVPPDQRLRLPHPRGRLDGRAGTGVHARRRVRLRRARAAARARRRRVRAAAVVLLRRPHRSVRGGREVPGGAPHLGTVAARPVRRAHAGGAAPAVPHADGRASPSPRSSR